VYHDGIDDPTAIIEYPEWAITAEDFETNEEGISTLIEGVEYEQIKFGGVNTNESIQPIHENE
jgi:hypothetical protein